jgi:hypothetical protein
MIINASGKTQKRKQDRIAAVCSGVSCLNYLARSVATAMASRVCLSFASGTSFVSLDNAVAMVYFVF